MNQATDLQSPLSNPVKYSIDSIEHILKEAFLVDNKLKVIGFIAFLMKEKIYSPSIWALINGEFIANRSYEPYRFMAITLPNMPRGEIAQLQELMSASEIKEADMPPIDKRPIGTLNPFAFDFSPYAHETLASEILAHQEKTLLETSVLSKSLSKAKECINDTSGHVDCGPHIKPNQLKI